MSSITRTERQKQGVKKWLGQKCCGTLCYATGVGIVWSGSIYHLKKMPFRLRNYQKNYRAISGKYLKRRIPR